MNTQELRQSLKDKWLSYYEENRQWLTKLGVWVNCDGQRRPSSGFILGTLSMLEPQLTQLLPLVVDLSSNPDRIVVALGLNFNPDEQLKAILLERGKANGKLPHSDETAVELEDAPVKMLPAAANQMSFSASDVTDVRVQEDEACRGRDRRD